MPHDNRFRHQPYHAAEPTVPMEVLGTPLVVEPQAAEYDQALVAACESLGSANLVAVYLVHGTFTGNDAFGTFTELQRFSPRLAERLRSWLKGIVNLVIDETGNYTPRFASTFQAGLSQGVGRKIPVRIFNWSSQNNHIARADGAVRLIAQLAEVAEQLAEEKNASSTPPRVMLWGHSHGGNVLALVTNLLAADRETRRRFFDAARVFYTPWLSKDSDMPAWEQVEELLETDHGVRRLPLDIVTFGTPIRYGWESRGYGNLLHFVNHRPSGQVPTHRTHHPLRPLHFFSALHGDYVHQLGIAGTNIIPVPLAVRTFIADRRLHDVLQSEHSWRGLLGKLAHGQRVHHEGPTLLVDYKDQGWRFWHHLWGHGVYTRRNRLPFHLAEIAKRFYQASGVR
ncbi:MAG: hypothetical protein SH868_18360 [Bythopirellula sp.]|nr:hypothetical protein [Bythopirellula sp.]